jgi:charged multivesicular body protein 4A/B
MQAEQLDEELLEPAAVPSTRVQQPEQRLPSVPAGRAPAARVPPKRTPEEDELEALQAEMAL